MDSAQLFALNREFEAAWITYRRWQSGLLTDLEGTRGQEPFAHHRRVAGQTLFEELAVAGSAVDEPLRLAARAWTVRFIQARVGAPLEVAWAEALGDDDPKGGTRALPGYRASWKQWVRDAAETSSANARRELAPGDVITKRAPALAAAQRELAARRTEVAARLGLSHPAVLHADMTAMHAAARDLLTRTDDLAEDQFASAPGLASRIGIGLAREAHEGWPAKPTDHWLDSIVGGFAHGLKMKSRAWPEPLGAASFVRALVAFGSDMAQAALPKSLPFALRVHPWDREGHLWGQVFARITLLRSFHLRVLGTSAGRARDQSRWIARACLFGLRVAALRLLVNDEMQFATKDTFEELSTRVFGARLPHEWAGAWPALRIDEPAHFWATVSAASEARSLRERFDEDWFRNPEAHRHVRSSLNHIELRCELDANAIDATVRELEELLG